jgi:hypothetical protein
MKSFVKKIVLIFVAMICFGIINVDAQQRTLFRTTQKLCSKNGERLEFYRDGSCLIRTSTLRFEGTYALENNKKEIVVKYESLTFRATVTWHDVTTHDKVIYAVFEGIKYERNLCKDE